MSNQNSNPPRTPSANNKMLIDATHPEETRVVVQRNGRVEEFDFESAARKLLRGNIYLAKITRVEPSLQAAFVDYGGNRHGFLAFNEIHPDYYQIPIADRRALIEAESAAEAEEEAAADRAAEAAARRRNRPDDRRRGSGRGERDEHADRDDREQSGNVEDVGHGDDGEDHAVDVSSIMPPEPIEAGAGDVSLPEPQPEAAAEPKDEHAAANDDAPRAIAERTERDEVVRSSETEQLVVESSAERSERDDREEEDASPSERRDEPRGISHADNGIETVEAPNGAESEHVETVTASEDVLEEVPVRPRRRLRSYKIQEVTKRRQVMLVQVVKEERGTKGAALTTYLSLAGRYTVLMPNTARGGGISRKITNPQDRKRLKAIAAELDVPEGMGLIIRTAGAARTKQEIKRDYEYLLRLWESVRELALSSNAPALVYEEGNLIKRSIRDLYGKEVDEIIVAGDVAYREAKDFMRMLMPSHAKNVVFYQDPEPLFTRYGMERQLNAMFSPYVHLRSGGYLVINQTEALVAIDINSGKSTREFSIEETALSTNLEAADEIARQLKLRDLAGLIVIDFIDMEEKRNNRAVERRLKDALRHDRARIQLGRISHFGLLEMSRQRMRTGVLEGSTTQCPHCQGTGIIRSTESVALAVLRGLEDALMVGQPASLTATTTATVALYILNHKRGFIVEMENRYGITIQIQASDKVQGANFTIDRQAARREDVPRRPERTAVNMDWGFEDETVDADGGAVAESDADPEAEVERSSGGEGGPGGEVRRRRRRRRGRRGDRENGGAQRPALGHGHHDDDAPDRVEAAGDEQPYVDDRGDDDREDDQSFVAEDEGHVETVGGDEQDEGGADSEGGEQESRRAEDGNGERRRRRRRGRRGGRRNQERERQPDEVAGEVPVEAGPGGGDLGDAPTDVPAAERDNGQFREASSESVVSEQPERARAEVLAVQKSEPEPVIVPEAPVVAEPQHAMAAAAASPEVVAAAPAAGGPHEVNGAAQPRETPVTVPTSRSAPVSSEPVLERVVVGPDAVAQTQVSEDASRSARRGWWQRR